MPELITLPVEEKQTYEEPAGAYFDQQLLQLLQQNMKFDEMLKGLQQQQQLPYQGQALGQYQPQAQTYTGSGQYLGGNIFNTGGLLGGLTGGFNKF